MRSLGYLTLAIGMLLPAAAVSQREIGNAKWMDLSKIPVRYRSDRLLPFPKHVSAPDLIVSTLEAEVITISLGKRVRYEWTITNVGTASAKLDGPTAAEHDNVSVQATLSSSTVFDIGHAAGGTIIGLSPLGLLAPGQSRSGSFMASLPANPAEFPYLVLRCDWGNVVAEANESNNDAAVGIIH